MYLPINLSVPLLPKMVQNQALVSSQLKFIQKLWVLIFIGCSGVNFKPLMKFEMVCSPNFLDVIVSFKQKFGK